MRRHVLPVSARRGAALLCLALTLTACGSGAGDDDGRGGATRGAAADWGPLPLDRYSGDHDGLGLRTSLAEDRLVRACMKRRGVPWDPPPVARADADPSQGRYGLTDADDARRSGYHVPEDPARARRNHYFLDELTTRQEAALDGDRNHPGCQGQAIAVLQRGVDRQRQQQQGLLVFRLGSQALEISARTPAVRAAKKAWSACMRERGHRYPSPEAAERSKRWDDGSPGASRQERDVAVADVACKEKVSLVRVWAKAEAAEQRRLMKRHGPELAAILKANAVRRANAGRVLS